MRESYPISLTPPAPVSGRTYLHCAHKCLGVENSDGDTSQALFFHPFTHGSQVLLDEFHHVAERASSFHDGIVFTNRPIQLHEKVTLKILKKEPCWHGGLRVGFTSMDPSKMDPGHLPPFACPHLVMQGKTWAAVLPDQCIEEGTILTFWVDHRGRVFFRSQQEARKLPLLKGIPVNGRLWAIIDVYGQTKAVQILGEHAAAVQILGEQAAALGTDALGSWSTQEGSQGMTDMAMTAAARSITSSFLPSVSHTGVENSDGDTSQALFFHPFTHGSQVLLDEFHHVAERASSFHDGIVFTNRPIQLHEKVTLKILKKEPCWHGGLRVGFTSMDPSKMDPGHLPPFACPHLVMQGKTWAAVLPDQCIEEGTILTFWVDHRGRVFFRSHPGSHRWVLCLASGQPSWTEGPCSPRSSGSVEALPICPFWKSQQRQAPSPPLTTEGHLSSQGLLTAAPGAGSEAKGTALGQAVSLGQLRVCLQTGDVKECVICCSHEANALLQPCGHATLCYCCAQEVFHNNQPCPFCREKIQDIVQVIPGAPALGTCPPVGNQPWPGLRSSWVMGGVECLPGLVL
uniref:Neuralized E3 ubiquitin protein ligase 3 n=1 Tax=Gopherus agassizii TaxID=38772 RepID=A0A452GNY2_9SAUR